MMKTIIDITDKDAKRLYDAAFGYHNSTLAPELITYGICVKIATDLEALTIWKDGKMAAECYPPNPLPTQSRAFSPKPVLDVLHELEITFW